MVFSSFFCQILVVLTWGWLYGTAVCLSYWVHVKTLPLNEEDITRYCFLQTNSKDVYSSFTKTSMPKRLSQIENGIQYTYLERKQRWFAFLSSVQYL